MIGSRASTLVVFLAIGSATAQPTDADGIAFYESRIRPLLIEQCSKCHGDIPKPKGNLRLDSRAAMLAGGDSGPALVPGDPDKSSIIRAVKHLDDLKMPPEKRLKDEQIADLAAWVKRGAPAPAGVVAPVKPKLDIAAAKQKWPFTPVPLRVATPTVRNATWPAGDVDRFILAKLEERGLAPVGDADRRTLIRRATYDLIGLPPTPEEIEAFVTDPSPDAFAKVVDRLLASPHYGERWGRHWLDVVRYSDTAGDNSDYPIPQMYLYRNWVIDAFNRDVPYDRFVREQLAGDLMGGDDLDRTNRIVATGYIANARRFGSRVDDYPQHLTIEDTLDNLGRAFLGLTVNCARCHDHKFDPISMEDYYGLYGIFHSTRYPWPGIELEKRQRDFVPLVPAALIEPIQRERQAELDAFAKAIKQLETEKAAAKDDKAKRDALDKTLQEKKRQREKLQQKPLPFPTAYAVAEAKKIENVAMQMKGDPEKPGPAVPRHFPAILGGQTLPPSATGSGRLHLANWIASSDNPLTARVMVNRIWHGHFGRGLVATPNDFGRQGQAPTHPELLDSLARRFIDTGYSIKAMHRVLMLTRTYQLASDATAPGSGSVDADATNQLLWKFRRHRLDAESIRDALLVLGGNLDRTPGGPHPFPEPTTWDFTQHKPFRAVYETNRRSVYLMTQRVQRHPFLAIFDGPDTAASTAVRPTSTTPLQSLYFLNDPFVHEQANRLAARLRSEKASDRDRIDLGYRLMFGRPATETEVAQGIAYRKKASELLAGQGADQQAWASYVRALLRLNEFVYVN